MRCPACNSALTHYTYNELELDLCSNCRGMWFDAGELKAYVRERLQDSPSIPDDKITLDRQVITDVYLAQPLKSCPRCRKIMAPFNYGYDSNIILDRCESCHGVWCDAGEVDQLASFTKGNPKLTALGKSALDEQRWVEFWKDAAEVSRSLSQNAALFAFMPKIIVPLRDDEARRTFPFALLGILLANVAVFACEIFGAEDIQAFVDTYGFVPAHICSGVALFTFITSLFLHGGPLHLAGNMFYFWMFADNVEDEMGHVRFFLFYLAAGAFGGLLHLLVYRDSTVPAIGSSGAIAGVMGAYFVFFPRAHIRTLIICNVFDVPAVFYLGVWILLQSIHGGLAMLLGTTSGIGWFAHIGGFAFGVVCALALKTIRRLRR